MFNLIPVALLITAIGGIVYITSNHLSEFLDDEENDNDFHFKFKARFIGWINQLPMDNIKNQSLSFTQKLLHRFRATLLKTDNYLMKLISKISQRDKTENENGKINVNSDNSGGSNVPDFWEELAKKKKEEQVIMPAAEPEVRVGFAVKSEAAKKFFDIKPDKKTLKTKKSSSPAGQAGK